MPAAEEEFGGVVTGTTAPSAAPLIKRKGSKGPTDATPGFENVAKENAAKSSEAQFAISFQLQYAFGSAALPLDGLQSFNDTKSSDRDINDRVLFRIGRKLCCMDPETGNQSFVGAASPNLSSGAGAVPVPKDILHFSLSKNLRHVCVCETARLEKSEITVAQATVYSTSTLVKLKTILNSNAGAASSSADCSGEYVCSAFSGDSKSLVLLLQLDDTDRTDARQIQVWTWDKERIFKCAVVPSKVLKISAAPALLLLATSGQGLLKTWYVAADATLKSANLLLPAKESPENFLDHAWLTSAGTEHRLVALSELDAGAAVAATANPSAGKAGGSVASNGSGASKNQSQSAPVARASRQSLFLFEGVELPVGSAGPPISLELKSTIFLKTEAGARLSVVASTAKGFVLAGSCGFVALFERTDDRREPYAEIRRVLLGDHLILAASLVPSEERLILLTKTSRLLSMPFSELLKPAPAEGSSKAKVVDADFAATDLVPGGFHVKVDRDCAIVAADSAYQKSLLITIGSDCTARMWNTVTMKCVLVHDLRADSPTAVALGPCGLQTLVAFKDKIRVYFVLIDKLKLHRDILVKNCRDVKYSNGSKFFAVAASVNVYLYDSTRFTQLMNFQGHMMTVKCLFWSANDEVLFSAGMDGNVYGWPLFSNERIDIVSSSARSSAILDLCSYAAGGHLFAKPVEATEEASEDEDRNADVNWNRIIITSADGSIKAPAWCLPGSSFAKIVSETPVLVTSAYAPKVAASNSKADQPQPGSSIMALDSLVVNFTAMALSVDKKFLFVGTNVGTLRVYNFPVSDSAGFFELFTQAASIKAIRESPSGKNIVVVSEDGSIFIFKVERSKEAEEFDTGLDVTGIVNDGADSIGNAEDGYIHDVAQVTTEDLDHYVYEISELQKRLSEGQAKFDFDFHSMESMQADMLKKLVERQDASMSAEKDRYDALQSTFDSRARELLGVISDKDTDHVRVNAELENRYEHKLADQYDRYDRLCEEIEQLKQRFEGLITVERKEFEKQLSSLKSEARNKEKRMNMEIKKTRDERNSDESAFKEILDQQEDEYEDELKQLIGAAENELSGERETILKLRTLVQTKNTKLDQLKKKLVEISAASKARLTLLQTEKREKQKLQDTIEHYKRNLMEREGALAEKEKVILDLRNTTRTLENFRFVLDHRLQQLFAERGPITTHIEDLENHISTMYEELVGEFDNKSIVMNQNEVKDKKIAFMSQELSKLRTDRREKELYIAAFKRELNNIVSSNTQGKDLEESIRLLYRKYVRGEAVGEKLTKSSDEVAQKVQDLVKGSSDIVSTAHLKGRVDLKETGGMSKVAHPVGGAAAGFGGLDTKMEKRVVAEVDAELIETAKEADRQKLFVERASKNLQHRLDHVREESNRQMQKRLMENSTLMFECNNLRKEVRDLGRKVFLLTEQNKDLSRRTDKSSHASHTSAVAMGSDGMLSTPAESLSKQEIDEHSDAGLSSLGGSLRQKVTSDLKQSESLGMLGGKREQYRVPGSSGGNLVQPGKLTRYGSMGALPTESSLVSPEAEVADIGSLHGDKLGIRKKHTMTVKLPTTTNSQQTAAPPFAQLDSRTGKRVGHDLLVQSRLHTEIDFLSTQLDMMQREKDMQRMEISRLRNQLLKLAGLSGNQGELPTLEDYFGSADAKAEVSSTQELSADKEAAFKQSVPTSNFDFDNISMGSKEKSRVESVRSKSGNKVKPLSPSSRSQASVTDSVISVSVSKANSKRK